MMINIFRGIICLAILVGPATAQESTSSIEEERAKSLADIGTDQIPDPGQLRAAADSLFSKPLEQQSDDELKRLAALANTMANLIDYLHDEYDDYYRESYRYDFVTSKLQPALDQYAKRGNEFKSIRNQAYFNLGVKAKQVGQTMSAFFYFRDAYRLSSFDCGKKGPKNCMRWLAEQEMQKLLSLSDVKAYVTWE